MKEKVRLRYKKLKNGRLITDPILCYNKVVVVTLDSEKFTYFCVERESCGVFYENSSSSLTGAKKHIKLFLRSIGANFYDEVRQGSR